MSRADAIRRLKSVRGHLDGIIRMLGDDRYCIDVLHQLNAVDGALDRTRRAILDEHLHRCVHDAYRDGRDDEIAEELLDVLFGGHTPSATIRHCHEAPLPRT